MASLREFLDDFFGEGPVSFCDFMQAALYHPEFGYYSANIRSVGRRGDFSTTVSLSPVLGAAIARWAASEHDHFGGAVAHLVEFGPGDGSLMLQVLDALPGKLRRKLHVHLVEISEPLGDIQRATLAKHRKRLHWHRSPESVLQHAAETAPGPLLCFSNEFVDAFPVRVFRAADVHELHLTYDVGRLSESWLPAGDPPPSTIWERDFPPAQRLEVHHRYRDWISRWASLPWTGSLLTIDYGDTAENLYHRRPHGTLRAYYRHQRLEGPELYARFGKQDLTADVNFSDLISWGETIQFLETLSLTTQREFLQPVVRPNSEVDAYLADPHGPGHAFRVLHQRRRAVDPPPTPSQKPS